MLSTWVWFPVFGDSDPIKVLIMSIFVVFATIYLAYGKFHKENVVFNLQFKIRKESLVEANQKLTQRNGLLLW